MQMAKLKHSNGIKGLVANFARPPAGGDTDQLKAAAAGVCDICRRKTPITLGA